LEDAVVTYRGPERVQLLRRWVAVLKDVEKSFGGTAEEKEKNLEQNLAPDEAKGRIVRKVHQW